MDGLMYQLRTNSTLQQSLGENIQLAGWKWINGEINQIRGIVNITFDIEGSTGTSHT